MRSSVWRFQTIGSIVLTFELIGSCLSGGQNRTPNPDQTRWETLKPQIEHVLIEDNILQQCDKDQTQITIDTATDTAGNRDPEAIVEYCHMGAYTSDALVMRLEHEKPVVVHFRESDGQIDDGNFLQGASVMHGEQVSLLPGENAVYSLHWDTDSQGELAVCTVRAFRWDRQTKTFAWDRQLTATVDGRECSKLKQYLHSFQVAAPSQRPQP